MADLGLVSFGIALIALGIAIINVATSHKILLYLGSIVGGIYVFRGEHTKEHDDYMDKLKEEAKAVKTVRLISELLFLLFIAFGIFIAMWGILH